MALVCGMDDPGLDGVADYTHRLAAALAAVGVDARVLGTGAGGVWDVVPRLRRADVVHVQFAPSAFGFSPAVGLLPAALRAGGVAAHLVTTLHEYGWWSWPPGVPDAVWRVLERSRGWDRETLALAPRSRALVVTNPGHGSVVRDRLRRTAVPVPIGPNVVDSGLSAPQARAAVRARWGVPPTAPLVVFFGFVHPVKGVRYLLEALPSLRAAHGDVRVVVAGGFTSLALPEDEARAFRAELEGRAAASGAADAVTFTGHVPSGDVSALLRAADAVVLPLTAGVTTKSGALLAALAHGAPVAATVADPPDPALRDGETVVAVTRRRDAAAVGTAVGRLLGDPGLRARVGAGGHEVARRHAWPVVAAAHAELYRRVLAGERDPVPA